MAELIDLVGLEMEKVGQHGPTPFELARSKAQIKAGLMMGLESSPSRAEQMARQLLSFGRLVPPAELVDCVESVSIEGIGKLARRLAGSRPSVAVVGAGKTSEKLAHIAADRMRRKGAGDGAWHS
jgi:predicted Zn-dependent peptidase